MSGAAEPGTRAARWAVPLVPFCFSAALSLATVGDSVFWQDSGFYLAALREFVPLYPPGFVLHLLLCKAWTLLVEPLAGFTRAVHLFSSLCAAGAAAVTALACEGFLSRFFPDRPRRFAAAGAGCLLAAGYSFGHAAILSKSYALFYLMVSVLLWLMVRAERRSEFLLLGLFLGLTWAAHPLGAFLIPVCVVYAVARRDRIREWGWAWFARVAACAALGAWGPSLLLPVLGSRQSIAGFGDPRSAGEFVRYLLGSRFLDQEGSFLLIAAKWGQLAEFVWEEYLGAGAVLLGFGLVEIWTRARRVVPVFAAWILPITGFTLVYVHEAYPDLWMVAVFLPLSLGVAAGLSRLGPRIGGLLLAAGLVWMAAVNLPDLNQKGYRHAEDYARTILRNVDPGAPLLLFTDDAISTTLYLRFVKGELTDRKVVSAVFLYEDWYRRLVEQRYGLKVPPWTALQGVSAEDVWFTLMANANAGPGRPVFCERRPDPRHLRADLESVPAGLFWKVGVRGEVGVELRYWDFGVKAEIVAGGRRRRRAHRISGTGEGRWTWHRETYEDRLIQPLLLARMRLADPMLQSEPGKALAVYDEILALDPAFLLDTRFRFNRAVALYLLDRLGESQAQFAALLEARVGGEVLTMSHYYLGELALAARRPEEARRHFRAALDNRGVDPAVLEHIRRRAGGP